MVDYLRRNSVSAKSVLPLILIGINQRGLLPSGMNVPLVRPLLNGRSRRNFGNYRPVSTLPCMSHILERRLFIVMTNFLDKFGSLCTCQYKFIACRGTQVLLDDLADSLYYYLENNRVSCVILVTKVWDINY